MSWTGHSITDKSLPRVRLQLRNSDLRYGSVAQLLHWAVAGLIVTQYVLALRASSLPLGVQKLATLAQHKSLGVTILGLAAIRLVWRAFNPVPPLPPHMIGWERGVADISHRLLYLLLFLTPLAGWFMSSARNFPVSWFGLMTLPDILRPSKIMFSIFRTMHWIMAYAMAAIAAVHIAAAIKHHFIDRDDVLTRMLPGPLRLRRRSTRSAKAVSRGDS